VLYGATSGRLYAAGQAGERFAVRNSGAEVVVEGCGANGCEYMTGGMAVILGPVGDNFGAGMTGGMAFVYDTAGDFDTRVNPDSVIWQPVRATYWESVLRAAIEAHHRETDSAWALSILEDWETALPRFVQVCPKEMVSRLKHPLEDAQSVVAAE
jgi:glutamate synthase (NADPH/NADH) large chain